VNGGWGLSASMYRSLKNCGGTESTVDESRVRKSSVTVWASVQMNESMSS